MPRDDLSPHTAVVLRKNSRALKSNEYTHSREWLAELARRKVRLYLRWHRW